jgi:CheY-like chemotaxis protein
MPVAGPSHGNVDAPSADALGSAPPAGARALDRDATAVEASMRVLVVDDHQQLAAMTRMALEWAGCRVEVADQGWRALALAERFRPDVVVCDLNLPDIDGAEVGRRLRASGHGRAAILIACSGAPPADRGAALIAAGFDAFLAKPLDIRRLLAAIAAAGGAPTAVPD